MNAILEFETSPTEEIKKGIRQFVESLCSTLGLANVAKSERGGRTWLSFEFAEPARACEFAARMSAMLGKEIEVKPGSGPPVEGLD